MGGEDITPKDPNQPTPGDPGKDQPPSDDPPKKRFGIFDKEEDAQGLISAVAESLTPGIQKMLAENNKAVAEHITTMLNQPEGSKEPDTAALEADEASFNKEVESLLYSNPAAAITKVVEKVLGAAEKEKAEAATAQQQATTGVEQEFLSEVKRFFQAEKIPEEDRPALMQYFRDKVKENPAILTYGPGSDYMKLYDERRAEGLPVPDLLPSWPKLLFEGRKAAMKAEEDREVSDGVFTLVPMGRSGSGEKKTKGISLDEKGKRIAKEFGVEESKLAQAAHKRLVDQGRIA